MVGNPAELGSPAAGEGSTPGEAAEAERRGPGWEHRMEEERRAEESQMGTNGAVGANVRRASGQPLCRCLLFEVLFGLEWKFVP